jgi:hypothetical protein
MPFIIALTRAVIYVLHQDKSTKNSRGTAREKMYKEMNINKPTKRRYNMKLNFTRRIKNVQPLFIGHYIDAKALYVLYFDRISNVCYIGNVEANLAYDYIKEKFRDEIVTVYQHVYFDHDKQDTLFNNTLFVLTGKTVIEVGTGYVHVLYEPGKLSEVKELIKALAEFKVVTAVPTYQTKVVGFAREPEMN